MLVNDLKWNSRMNNIVVKAHRSLGFVKQNLYPCHETTKRSAYVTIVRPVDSIEAVLRHAARFKY